jgi:hypothetical protein
MVLVADSFTTKQLEVIDGFTISQFGKQAHLPRRCVISVC